MTGTREDSNESSSQTASDNESPSAGPSAGQSLPQPIPAQRRRELEDTDAGLQAHGTHRTNRANDPDLPRSPDSPRSASPRRSREARSPTTSPLSSPTFSEMRSLRRVPSYGTSAGASQASPPGGNWIQHSGGVWPEGQFSASSTARISSPLAESAIEHSVLEHPPRAASSGAATDAVNSVWPDSPPYRELNSPTSSDGDPAISGMPLFGTENEVTNDKTNLGFPRLSSLSLSASPPVVQDASRSSPSHGGSIASTMSTSPRGSPWGSMATSGSTPESPPKVRSNIALPPRSGYSLSDDSDSLRSETDGSNGSGVSSSGSETDADAGANEDDDDDDDESRVQLSRWQVAQNTTQPHDAPDRRAASGALEDTPYKSIEEDDTSNDADAEDEVSRDGRDPPTSAPFATRDLDETEDALMSDFVQEPAVDLPPSDTVSALPDGDSLDDGLSSLERIFLFAKSDMAYHRVLVSRCLTEWIREVELSDAVEYVIPLLNELATDEVEVSSVFAPELGRLIWFFFRNCPLAELSDEAQDSSSDEGVGASDGGEEDIIPRPKLPVGIFTPLLCTLLLNPNSAVSGATQASIVEYFLRSKQFDEVCGDVAHTPTAHEHKDSSDVTGPSPNDICTADLALQGNARDGKLVPLAPYDFGREAREAVLNELFDNVAIAISRFDSSDNRSLQSEEPSGEKTGPAETSHSASTSSDGFTAGSLDQGQYDEETALGRMMSVNLLAAITVEGGFSTEQLALRVVPEITHWPRDPAFFVRKEVAAAIGIIGKALVLQQTRDTTGTFDYAQTQAPQCLLAALNRVLLDHVWQVRQAACYSLPGVFALQPAGQERRRELVITMRALNQDVSPNVQLAAFEMIGEVIYLFHNDPDGVPPELLRIFLGQPDGGQESDKSNDAADLLNNPDKSLIVAFNFPAVVLSTGAQHWDELRELYLQLTHHTSETVRNSLGASLHEVAKLISSDAVSRDLVPVAERLLRDPCTDVTVTLLEHIHEFWLVLPLETVKTQLRQLPMLWMSQYAHDWRLRESMAKHIPALAPSLLLADEDGCLVTLLLLALNDSVNALREVGEHAVPVVYATFYAHDETIADGFLSMLCDLVEAAAYRQRVTFLHVVSAVVDHGIPRERFEAQIMPYLVRLAHDGVIDVRIALARTVRQVWQSAVLYPEPAMRPHALVQLVATLQRHACLDVARPVQGLLSDDTLAATEATLPPSPARKARELQLGPARSLLDTTTIPWRGAESGEQSSEAPLDDLPSSTPHAMDQDT